MERSTEGIRSVMFDQIERFLKGEVDANHLNALKAGFTVILSTVEKDLQAQKMVSDLRRGRDQPQCVADLNLNLKLGGSVVSALNDAAGIRGEVPE